MQSWPHRDLVLGNNVAKVGLPSVVIMVTLVA